MSVFTLAATTPASLSNTRVIQSAQETIATTQRNIATASNNIITSQADIATTQRNSWKAGDIINSNDMQRLGADRFFSIHAIDDSLFARMYGKSYKADCTTRREELRYVRVAHYNGNGEMQCGELVCHESVAESLKHIFRQLFEAHYQIERMVLIDNYDADDLLSMEANNSSCFNFRRIAGSHRLSNHSYGTAIDINPLYNPMVKRRKDGSLAVSPKKGRPYADRTRQFKYKIDSNDLACRLFKKHGFVWGGDYRSLKDYQHFEKKTQ